MATNNSINDNAGNLVVTSEIVDPAASSDSYVQFKTNSTNRWRLGSDQDASATFKISAGSALGTSDCLTIDTSGQMNMPLQPAFLATHTVDQLNVTGNNVFTTVNFTTEVFDLNGDYDGTNTFTAPVTGIYCIGAAVSVSGITASNQQVGIYQTGSGVISRWGDLISGSKMMTSNKFSLQYTINLHMDAADTAYIRIYSFGDGSNVNDLLADAERSYIFGYLVG